jgi:hypothetical protein
MQTQHRYAWRETGRQALVSGSIASILSTTVLATRGVAEVGSAVAPTNATSHWLWGESAYDEYRPTLKHTALGYLTHHASAIFWAFLLERALDRKHNPGTAEIIGSAAITTALAAFVDYELTPRRLRPGFETHLSRGSLVATFAAIGAGLAIGALLNRRHERRMEKLLTLEE